MAIGSFLGLILIESAADNDVRMLSGIMALVLIGGDAFHLIPRIVLIVTGKEEQLRRKLGRGKQITSITMTFFYLLLWHIGLIIFSLNTRTIWTYSMYFLAFIRIVLCLMPQNKWEDMNPPLAWGLWRNLPFFLQGAGVACVFFLFRGAKEGFGLMWLAIVLSFAFYVPVVLWSNTKPKIGMLMLPKTCSYLWILVMCLSL